MLVGRSRVCAGEAFAALAALAQIVLLQLSTTAPQLLGTQKGLKASSPYPIHSQSFKEPVFSSLFGGP